MGSCLSCAAKVSGSNSSNASAAGVQQGHPAAQNRPGKQQDAAGKVPYGKRTDFGYDKDFESRYAIGKFLGHGQFGYTFVATDKAGGERVAVKRIDKSKIM
ncbi:calcium-dependent protein kinase 28-like [Phoenix dactylifera]|uniref:Calcium-dependent protein kinase 28-like n=1 Tax=Phoenix dactylifera TaxID=42345 RepID=A0A8B8ZYY1_PHODC|nr:calcium-dependent protein kinase 28-like [Phoenix dactylifera]